MLSLTVVYFSTFIHFNISLFIFNFEQTINKESQFKHFYWFYLKTKSTVVIYTTWITKCKSFYLDKPPEPVTTVYWEREYKLNSLISEEHSASDCNKAAFIHTHFHSNVLKLAYYVLIQKEAGVSKYYSFIVIIK